MDTSLLSAEALRKIDDAIKKYPEDQQQSAVMAALAIAQQEKGWLSPAILSFVAQYLKMPAIAVQEVASFYSMYRLKPAARYKLRLCTNLPCALAGAAEVGASLQKKLSITYGENTPCGTFSLDEAECMGACGDAPVILVNETQMHSFIKVEKIDSWLQSLSQKDVAKK